FRVGAKEGFIPGHVYEVEYTPRFDDSLASDWRYPRSIKFVLGKPVGDIAQGKVLLEKDGLPKVQKIPLPMGGSCSGGVAASTQWLRYSVPNDYLQYKSLMVFFTKSKPTADGGLPKKKENPDAFRWLNYVASDGNGPRFGSSDAGHGRELVYEECGYGAKVEEKTLHYRVKGYAGLLEVDDVLQETPEIDVTISTKGCSAPPWL
ncbi:MAG: hypothetical protein REI12_08995, partial [Pedobacter sp.]|nr:hypothetical protein [Pedobacter sp.]